MSLADDLKNVYRAIPGIETVTLTPQGTGATPVTGVQALRRVMSMAAISFATGAPGIDRKMLTFHLWVSTLGGTIPKNGDKITDANNVVYTIDSVDLTTLGTRYKAIVHPNAVNQP